MSSNKNLCYSPLYDVPPSWIVHDQALLTGNLLGKQIVSRSIPESTHSFMRSISFCERKDSTI